MSETYDITYGGVYVGSAKMKRQGLYYSFICRCSLPDAGIYRIHVITGDRREDLGICVPMGDTFGMDKLIPAKHLGEGNVAFELLPKNWEPKRAEEIELQEPAEQVGESVNEEQDVDRNEEETFIPVQEEEPFDYLDHLEHAVLAVKEDQIGVIIPEIE